jgi:hypothetical protein
VDLKTITMDWETYIKELSQSQDAIKESFEKGANENKKRLRPIVEWCLEFERSCHEVEFLRQLLIDAGEL